MLIRNSIPFPGCGLLKQKDLWIKRTEAATLQVSWNAFSAFQVYTIPQLLVKGETNNIEVT